MSEKYLSVKILNGLVVNCFLNKTKTGNQPDFKGDGVAIWVNEKKDEVKEAPLDYNPGGNL